MSGYLPAQLYLAEAYLNGDLLRRNEFKAAYWYARARLSGAPVDERFETIGETLDLDQRFKIQSGLEFSAGGFTVQEDEVLSGVRF